MSKLTDFLISNPVDGITDKVVISTRLKDFPFEISAMSGDQFGEYQKLSTAISKGKKVTFDSNKFNNLTIVNHTIEPNFKSAEDIKKAGCRTPEEYLNKVLLAGEKIELSKAISSLSGFDTPDEEIVEEAKNS